MDEPSKELILKMKKLFQEQMNMSEDVDVEIVNMGSIGNLIGNLVGDMNSINIQSDALQHICESINAIGSLQAKLIEIAKKPKPTEDFDLRINAEEFQVITASVIIALRDRGKFLEHLKDKKEGFENILSKAKGRDSTDTIEPSPFSHN